MKCPKCGAALPFITCPSCGGEYPEKGAYCCWCGIPAAHEADQESGTDFSDRKLCSDGTCIGVINEKGVCSICGMPYSEKTG
jgi:hypothetical protein